MQERSTARYSKTYRLAFSLLSEDSPSDITGLGWEVETALNRDLTNFLPPGYDGLYGSRLFVPHLRAV